MPYGNVTEIVNEVIYVIETIDITIVNVMVVQYIANMRCIIAVKLKYVSADSEYLKKMT